MQFRDYLRAEILCGCLFSYLSEFAGRLSVGIFALLCAHTLKITKEDACTMQRALRYVQTATLAVHSTTPICALH